MKNSLTVVSECLKHNTVTVHSF